MQLIEPHIYPRRVLLMVTGRSPQVVTETIYALCKEQDPPFIPTEVQIITTSEGADDARLALLSDDPGWFERLCRDWNLPKIKFGPEQIRVLLDANGQPLSDIRTRADNDQTADFIVDAVRKLTEDDQCALHVSLAGGRKTMGYFLGYALSLYGRHQDRLSHVLVSQPFESNRDFYYPTPTSRVIYSYHAASAQQRPLDAKDGKVMLADIPFVRMRDSLPSLLKGLKTGTISFSGVITSAQSALLSLPSVTISYYAGASGLRIADGRVIRLNPADLVFYGWIARRQQRGDGPILIPSKQPRQWQHNELEEYFDQYLVEERQVDVSENTGKKIKDDKKMSYEFIHQRKTSIKNSLETAIGPLATRYEIKQLVEGRPGRFGLDIEPTRIKFINSPI